MGGFCLAPDRVFVINRFYQIICQNASRLIIPPCQGISLIAVKQDGARYTDYRD